MPKCRPSAVPISGLDMILRVCAAAASCCSGRFLFAGPSADRPQSSSPYIATPDDVVDRMLALAQVTREDVVYDLGCGDGRIPIAAAKKYGARGRRARHRPELIALSIANAKAAGVETWSIFAWKMS